MLNQSLGHLASCLPGATRVFHQFGLDFCCGGQQSLEQAALFAGLDPQLLVAQLQKLDEANHEAKNWLAVPPEQLIDHILVRYHAVHREQLPELHRLAQKVENVHQYHPDCPHGLTGLLEAIQQELESHMRKEEMILFPLLRRDTGMPVGGPISVMRMEHDQHASELRKLDQLTRGIQPPEDACNTWQALYLGLRAFREDLMEHIHLENNILFEQAEQALRSGAVQHG